MSSSKSNLSEIFRFQGTWLIIFFIMICVLGSSYLGYLIPQGITELSRAYDDTVSFHKALYFLSGLFLGVFGLRIIYQLLLNKYVQLLIQNMRSITYRKWLLSYDSITSDDEHRSEGYPLGEVIARIMSDTQAVRELLTSGAFSIVIDIFFVAACLIGFIKINTTSGVALTIAEVFASTVLIWGSRYMREVFHSVRKSRGLVSQHVANVVGGIKEIFFIKDNRYSSRSGEKVYNDFVDKQLKANVWDASYYSVAESLYPLLLILVVFIFPYSKITEAAVILAIVDLIQRSISPIKNIAGKIANIQRAVTGFQRVSEFTTELDRSESSDETASGTKLSLSKMNVNIEHFSYPVKSTPDDSDTKDQDQSFELRNIKFEALRGELIGIVGLSGCGKSTLMNILCANIIPDKFAIQFFDNQGLMLLKYFGQKGGEAMTYREQVGLVSQDSHIFSASLLFNISMKYEVTEEFSKFWDWVCGQIPYLNQWGLGPEDILQVDEMSLGQKQLISALRACFLKKGVVIFDEISSALDSELEEALRKVILLVQEQSITYVVAHRLETVVNSDNILVLENGELISSGKHHDLLWNCEPYKEFIKEITRS